MVFPKTKRYKRESGMAVALVPYIAFLEVRAVFAQKVPILLLKTARAMVLML